MLSRAKHHKVNLRQNGDRTGPLSRKQMEQEILYGVKAASLDEARDHVQNTLNVSLTPKHGSEMGG